MTGMSTLESCQLDTTIAPTLDLYDQVSPITTPCTFDENDSKYSVMKALESHPATMKLSDYFDKASFDAIKAKADTVETPAIVIDSNIVAQNYDLLANTFPYGTIYFAVKANPNVALTEMLIKRGSSFDIASRYELDRVLTAGLNPLRASYGNTIKKKKDIAYFYSQGVRLYATDSLLDLQNIASNAPGSGVYVRILLDGGADTSDWPLSKKFGCVPKMAYQLLIKAKELGLIPRGVSFHVGSQQHNIDCWTSAINIVAKIYEQLKIEHDISCDLINLGGGLCCNYVVDTKPLQDYERVITQALDEAFANGTRPTTIIFEPGRSLVGSAGVVLTEIVLASYKGDDEVTGTDYTTTTTATGKKWVYTDAGLFNGLIETLGEALKYPVMVQQADTDAIALCSFVDEQEQYDRSIIDFIQTQDADFKATAQTELLTQKRVPVVLAGPTCDSTDIMYQDTAYRLPTDITQGDKVWFLSCGAYTDSYASNNFNGFPPIKSYVVNSRPE